MIQPHLTTTRKGFRNFCLLCYWLVFLLLVQEYDFVVTQCWNCLCTIGGSVFQQQQSLSVFQRNKIFVGTSAKSLLSKCRSSTGQGCAQNQQHDFQSDLASFWILRDKRAILADGFLLLSDRSCDVIVENTRFWHLWWILIGIACPWLSFTTFVNSDSPSISPYLWYALKLHDFS